MPDDSNAAARDFSVPGARHLHIGLGRPAPDGAELHLEYRQEGRSLARERRPLASGQDRVSVKTPPGATSVSCTVQVAGRAVDATDVTVDCGNPIEPVGRHFIVIGAMKAGTTTLFQMLARHPALCQTWVEVPDVSFTKEINYFRDLFQKGDSPLHYDWRFPFDPARHSWTLDVSPNYAKLPRSRPVPARIARLGGTVRLAYVLREPVDRIESHMAHMLGAEGRIGNPEHCLRLSRYALHLDNFTARIPREQILLLDFDKLRRRPAAVHAEICDFLEIERVRVRASVHNRRSVGFRLDAAQRQAFAAAVRADVERLVHDYGFLPARKWLREPSLKRLRLRR